MSKVLKSRDPIKNRQAFAEEGWRKQLVKTLTEAGRSANHIAQRLGLNTRSVHRIRAKIRRENDPKRKGNGQARKGQDSRSKAH